MGDVSKNGMDLAIAPSDNYDSEVWRRNGASPVTVSFEPVFEPEKVLERAERAAVALRSMLDKRRNDFIKNIKGKDYLLVEAWQLCGAFFGCSTEIVSVTPLIQDGKAVGYESRARVINGRGEPFGAGSSVCLYDEPSWSGWKPSERENACYSKAQARSISRALRNTFGWVAKMAGYEATPAEEMDSLSKSEPQHKTRETSTAPAPDRNPMKNCFALETELRPTFEDAGVSKEAFWGWVKQHYGVASRAEMTDENWRDLQEHLNGAAKDESLFRRFVQRVRGNGAEKPSPPKESATDEPTVDLTPTLPDVMRSVDLFVTEPTGEKVLKSEALESLLNDNDDSVQFDEDFDALLEAFNHNNTVKGWKMRTFARVRKEVGSEAIPAGDLLNDLPDRQTQRDFLLCLLCPNSLWSQPEPGDALKETLRDCYGLGQPSSMKDTATTGDDGALF